MKFSLDSAPGRLLIDAYGPDRIVVAGTGHALPLVIGPAGIAGTPMPPTLAELEIAHLEQLAALGAEVLLIGTGAHQRFLDRAIIQTMGTRGIGIEVMNTPAACRCYNVLVSEQRAVVAALFGG